MRLVICKEKHYEGRNHDACADAYIHAQFLRADEEVVRGSLTEANQ
jgi:hypothetical protein